MRKKQLFGLLVCNLSFFIIGNGPIGLLAVYATRLGADSTQIGYLLSSIFLALTAGTLAAGWLSDRLQCRKLLLILGAAVQIPIFWLIGQATTIGQLDVLMPISGFFVGGALAMSSALVGLFAGEGERGRIFGILATTGALGGLIGGLASGPIADRWGYPALFSLSAVVFALAPLAGLLLEDKVVPRVQRREASPAAPGFIKSRAFFLLFLASTIAFLTNSVYGLGKPLMMDKLGFDATAISSTMAVGGLIALPLPLLIGWLSDRVGRRPLIIVCYAANAAALFILVVSASLWHFWIATAFQSILATSLGVGSALVTDLVPPDSLGAALSLFAATNWIGFVIGSAGAGTAIERLGMTPTLLIGALLELAAIVCLLPIRPSRAVKPVLMRG